MNAIKVSARQLLSCYPTNVVQTLRWTKLWLELHIKYICSFEHGIDNSDAHAEHEDCPDDGADVLDHGDVLRPGHTGHIGTDGPGHSVQYTGGCCQSHHCNRFTCKCFCVMKSEITWKFHEILAASSQEAVYIYNLSGCISKTFTPLLTSIRVLWYTFGGWKVSNFYREKKVSSLDFILNLKSSTHQGQGR